MSQLLLELGCEELPASAVSHLPAQLGTLIAESLLAARLGGGEVHTYGTPRRIIVAVDDVSSQQPRSVTRVRGPSLKAAFDAAGAPSKALEGFCRGQGVPVDAVVLDADYAWVDKQDAGGPALGVLAELIPRCLAKLEFAKTMRWGSGATRFGRPVRWILAVFDGDIVSFEFAGIASGAVSRGHRFRAPDAFDAVDLDGHLHALRSRFVEPDPGLREARIRELAGACSGGRVRLSDELVAENAGLSEWPECHMGMFDQEYLALPEFVLETVLAKHERFFLVDGASGGATNAFVAVRNGGEEEAVRRGNAWVVNARLNDARFFALEDGRRTIDDFLGATSRITFQAKLGTVLDRTERLAALCRSHAETTGGNPDHAEQAGRYAKADLASGLVAELDELQGLVGGEYLRRGGAPLPVCAAVESQYDLKRATRLEGDELRTALTLVIVDQVDKLAGYLGIGVEPTGSSDPFGLRRAAGLIVEGSWAWPGPMSDVEALFERAVSLYVAQGVTIAPNTIETFRNVISARYEPLSPTVRPDVVAAAIPAEVDPRQFRFRREVLERLVVDPAWIQSALRPVNIVAAARKKGHECLPGRVDHALLDSPEGEILDSVCMSQSPLCHHASQAEAPGALVAALEPLRAPTDRFFDATMVMVDDDARRDARLRLAANVAALWGLAGDVTKIVIEG